MLSVILSATLWWGLLSQNYVSSGVKLRNLRIYHNSKKYFMDLIMDISYIHQGGLSTTWVQFRKP